MVVLVVLVAVAVALLGVVALMGWNGRRHGHRLRDANAIGNQVRQSELDAEVANSHLGAISGVARRTQDGRYQQGDRAD